MTLPPRRPADPDGLEQPAGVSGLVSFDRF